MIIYGFIAISDFPKKGTGIVSWDDLQSNFNVEYKNCCPLTVFK